MKGKTTKPESITELDAQQALDDLRARAEKLPEAKDDRKERLGVLMGLGSVRRRVRATFQDKDDFSRGIRGAIRDLHASLIGGLENFGLSGDSSKHSVVMLEEDGV